MSARLRIDSWRQERKLSVTILDSDWTDVQWTGRRIANFRSGSFSVFRTSYVSGGASFRVGRGGNSDHDFIMVNITSKMIARACRRMERARNSELALRSRISDDSLVMERVSTIRDILKETT